MIPFVMKTQNIRFMTVVGVPQIVPAFVFVDRTAAVRNKEVFAATSRAVAAGIPLNSPKSCL